MMMKLPQFVFRPRLLDELSSYSRARFIKDLGAGVTVAMVALPLAMAFAIGSGLPPQAGIFTAVIAGFLISALGGSRVQIGGPAGAFVVIVYGIVERYGVSNLIIATVISGFGLFALGALRLGGLIRFIPLGVVIGFTNGIAVLIALSQVKDFLGLSIAKMPADFFSQIGLIFTHLHTVNGHAVAIALMSLAIVVGWTWLLPGFAKHENFHGKLTMIPGTVVALAAATAVTAWLSLPVETIGSKFGGIPQALPAFALPQFSWESSKTLFAPIMTLTVLGAIESLLCARVADAQMNAQGKQRHNPNQELMAQGVANIITPFFGGMPATGTIARTVTNLKSGATSPVAGIVHALALLLIILAAAPLANHVPLAGLAAILMYVAWNMGEWHEFARLRQFRLPYRVVLVGTFLLTVIFDLTVAVQVGLMLACLVFIYRISSLTRVDAADQQTYPLLRERFGEVRAWRLYGALFFGTVNRIEELGERLPSKALILDFKNVLYIDSTGADSIEQLYASCTAAGVRLMMCGLREQPLDMLTRSSLLAKLPVQDITEDLTQAVARA
jgi:SulP family sulfate permease